MSRGGLPVSVVMRFSSIDCSVINLSVLVSMRRGRGSQSCRRKTTVKEGWVLTKNQSSLCQEPAARRIVPLVLSHGEAYGMHTFNIDLSEGKSE
jgi:hypothetical protein